MTTGRKIFAAILSILLIFNLNLLVYSYAVRSTVLNPDFLTQKLEEANFYSLLKKNLMSTLSYQVMRGQSEELTEILNKSITERWLKNQTNSLVTSLLSYLNSDTDKLVLEVSLREPKQNLKENLDLPPSITDKLTQVPSQANVLQTLPEKDREKLKKGLRELRKGVGYFRLAFKILLISAGVLILLIALLVKKAKSILRKIGIPFFISGSSLYLGNVLVLKLVSQKFTPEKLPPFLPQEVLLKILRDFLSPINDLSIVFMVLGLVLIAVSFVFKNSSQ